MVNQMNYENCVEQDPEAASRVKALRDTTD